MLRIGGQEPASAGWTSGSPENSEECGIELLQLPPVGGRIRLCQFSGWGSLRCGALLRQAFRGRKWP